MSLWHEHAMADARWADLRREADIRHARRRRPVGASARMHTGPRMEPGFALRERVGILLVEAGLHLITVGRG
jgi:hypothetical protein